MSRLLQKNAKVPPLSSAADEGVAIAGDHDRRTNKI